MLITRKILISLVLLSLTVGFGSGFAFYKYHLTANTSLPVLRNLINKEVGQPEDLDFSLFWEVWSTLHKKYVDPGKLDTQKLLNGAISGMVDAVGDPYTTFFEPVVSQKFQEEISGSFGGVGMELGKRDNTLTVIAPIPDSPAAKAGIKAGDKLVSIDKESALDLSVEAAVGKIRGEKGTKVMLTMARPGQAGTFDVELTREAIKIPSIKWKQIGDIAYLQIITFNGNVEDDFVKAAKEILKSNSKKLIVDVRNNPGGLLDAAINISGWFIDKNQIVVREEFID
jgi:carboxyl-terminal processing protease